MVYRSWLNDVQAMAEGQGEPHDVSAVSLLKSGEQRYIKAIIVDRCHLFQLSSAARELGGWAVQGNTWSVCCVFINPVLLMLPPRSPSLLPPSSPLPAPPLSPPPFCSPTPKQMTRKPFF